jgi:hypothetical protein
MAYDAATAFSPKEEGHSKPIACQAAPVNDQAVLTGRVKGLKAHTTRRYAIQETACPSTGGVKIVDCPKTEQAHAPIDGKRFTTYCYASTWARPFLYPMVGSGGVKITRHYPMERGTVRRVRDYGPMTANCFAWSRYRPKAGVRAEMAFKKGRKTTWRYRICLHEGDARQGKVSNRFLDFFAPPIVAVA